jgi:parallel beta-helix repeat protein
LPGIGERIVVRKAVTYIIAVLLISSFLLVPFGFSKNTESAPEQRSSLPKVDVSQAIQSSEYKNESAKEFPSASLLDAQPTVVRHKMTTLEIEKLKQEIGTYDENQTVPAKTVGEYAFGCRPPTESEWKQIANDYAVDMFMLPENVALQSSVDHSTELWFPPIGNQNPQSSCVAWAVGYYMKTYQEAKEHQWAVSQATFENGQPSQKYQDRIMSPAFVYNLINGGQDGGSSPGLAMNLVCCVGASSWETMPWNPSDSTSWPPENAWREAPSYRGSSDGCLWMTRSSYPTPADWLTNVKNLIASGNLAAICFDGTQLFYYDFWGFIHSRLTSNDALTLDQYGPPYPGSHCVTIVGYDDGFTYTEQGQTRQGAFKIANSWGLGGWENVADGYFWISYEVMKQRNIDRIYYYNDRIGYVPKLVASFRINHSKRSECDIDISVGGYQKHFNEFIWEGDQPFCANNILLDITELVDYMPDPYNQQYCLTVMDSGTSTTGVVQRFAVEYAESDDTPISTINNGYVSAYVTLARLQTSWRDEKPIHSDNDFIDNKIAMATDGNGYLYVAYEDWYPAGGQQAIFLNRSTDDGRTWSYVTQWYWGGDDCHNPSIAIDPYDNKIYVAYEREDIPTDNDIYCCVYTPSGSESHVLVSVGNENDRFPSITSEYQYGAFNYQCISYEYVHDYDDRDLMFAYTTNHGNSWTWKKIYGDFYDPNVHTQTSITNAEGYVYIAYRHGADYNSVSQIHLVRSSNYFSSWTQVTNLDGGSTNCRFPTIAASHGGHSVVVAFENAYSANNTDIRYSYSTDNGGNWVKGLVLLGSVENEMSPSLTVDGGGSTSNSVGGYFHLTCKVDGYMKYTKANRANLASWTTPTFVSDVWAGKGLAITTRYRNVTTEYHPCIAWNDERNNNVYYSTLGEVHNLNSGLSYSTIQQAIDSSSTFDGQTLFVESRVYRESVFVTKSLALIGENVEDAIVESVNYQVCLQVEDDGVMINNFTLRCGTIGVLTDSWCKGTTIQNNLITKNTFGILDCANDSFVSNNIVLFNNEIGISLDGYNSTLRSNHMIGNPRNFAVGGWNIQQYLRDVDTSNTVDGRFVYYLVNQNDLLVDNSTHPNIGFLALVNSTNVRVQGLVLERNDAGILLAYTNNSVLSNNILKNNGAGVRLFSSSRNTIGRNNTIRDNLFGVEMFYSSNNDLQGDLIQNNTYGIYLVDSTSNDIFENFLNSNQRGIQLEETNDNLIYHNNFLNNTVQVHDFSWDYPESYLPSVNLWDNSYPSGGNYWSDYTGIDLCKGPYQNVSGSDGIGDAPYGIDGNNTDSYPLINPWSSSQYFNLTIVSWPIENVTLAINGAQYPAPYTDSLLQGHYLVEMPAVYNRYAWSHWLEDGDINRTKDITVEADSTWTAVYIPQYLVTFGATGLDSSANGTVVTVNGIPITSDQMPYSIWIENGSIVTYFYSNVTSLTVGKQFVLNEVIGQASPFTVTAAVNITGNYMLQHQIIFDQAGIENDYVGTVVTIDGEYYGYNALPVSFWWDIGSSHSFSFSSPLVVNASRLYNWNSTSGLIDQQSGNLVVAGSGSVTGNYVAETRVQITFTQTGLSSDYIGYFLIVDGINYTVADQPVSFWWVNASAHSFSYLSPLTITANTKQYVWTSTTGLSSSQYGSITATSDGSISGNYKTQYYLTITSTYDSPTQASGWFDAGENITVSVTSPVSGLTGIRYACTGWVGSGDAPAIGTNTTVSFTISQPSTIAWTWKTQFIMTVITSPHWLKPQPIRQPDSETGLPNSWWYDASSTVTLTANTITGFAFNYWSVDGISQGSETNPVSVDMNTPHIAVAHYNATSPFTDIAVLNLAPFKTIVGRGYTMTISITVENQGTDTETFNLTLYAETNAIATQTLTLEKGSSIVTTVVWNTTGAAYGNYTLSAYAELLPLEMDIPDNNCTCDVPIHVGVPGDISGPTQGVYDGTTNMRDVNYLILLFNTNPSSPNWKPNADINNDGTVNMRDIQIAILNFNKHE